ncbi:small subunit rRNA maturation protein TSR4 [Aspergillus undulatus]|uniref:small subunit rRNA maturation protein TSR4 n=1 Tax=Aspergillus undulatus TaxID=1810928 RepID=UPI003CCD7305
MDPYDSDSSGYEDEGDYTETGVVLGYASEEIIEDTITHIGGWPTWIDESTPPSGEFAKCKVCNNPMSLLLEIDAELYEHFPDADRRLYIFSCPRKPCNRKPGSIRALRATRYHKIHQPAQKTKKQETEKKDVEQPKVQAPKPDLGASLFGSNTLTSSVSANANPFSLKQASAQSSNPFAAPVASPAPAPPTKAEPQTNTTPSTSTLAESFADKVRVSSPEPSQQTEPQITGPPTPWPSQSDFPTPYTNFYIDAEGETLSRPPTPKIPENVTIEAEDADAGSGGADLKDTFESELDKAFMKFSTRLAHNPEQVLRYEFRGSPVLYSYTDAVGKRLYESSLAKLGNGGVKTVSSGGRMPRCESCGAERVFEVQLVPHTISVLEEGRDDVGLGDGGMEWGTIIMGVCSRNCGPREVGVVGYREEWAGVQWEEAGK